MPSFKDSLKTILTGSGGLTALLTGGVLDAQDLPRDGGGANDIPRQLSGLINPFAIIRFREANRTSADVLNAALESVEVYVYEDTGYNTIDAALALIFSLLNAVILYPTDRAIASLQWVHTSTEMIADEYGYAPMKMMRFQTTTVR